MLNERNQRAPMDGSRVLLAAHRGDKKRYPENTMPAFIAANAAGVDMIETDLHMSADGELVIMHDRSALRTAGVDRNLDEMTLAEIRELDACCASLFGDKYAGTKVPTVREFLEWVKGTNLLVNWELKDYPSVVGEEHAFRSADLLVSLIDEYGMTERSMVNSFSARVIEHIAVTTDRRYPVHGQGIYGAPKSNDVPDMPVEDLFDWCCMYADVKGQSPVDFPDNFRYCTDRGIIPCVCIPDTEDLYGKAIKYGCRMFTSNDIVKGDEVLRALGVR